MLFQELTVNIYRLIFDAFWTYRTVELWSRSQVRGGTNFKHNTPMESLIHLFESVKEQSIGRT